MLLTVVRRVALVAALLAMALGLGNRTEPAAQRLPELDVLVAVDVTTSMSALDDPSGSRITAVRGDLAALGEHLDTGRFAVVTFGRSADVRLPFTTDRVAYDATVRSLQVEPADAGAGTSVGRPVPLLEDQLRQATEQDRIPVVVFVSDGENTASGPQASFADVGGLAEAAVVLGYGTEAGGVMPLERVAVTEPPPAPSQVGTVVTAATGEPALSRLDASNLRGIAEELGGTFVHCDGSQDIAGLAAALEAAAYADLDPGEPERELRWLWALLVIAFVLPELRAGWRGYLEARREGRP